MINLVSVRLAVPDDSALLKDLARRGGLRKDLDYFDFCLKAQKEGAREVMIGIHAGQPCGYCLYNRAPPYAPFKRLGIPEIQDLNVVPESRRNGVGSALIDFCEDLARGEKRDMIGIGVGLYAGYGAAQRLYVQLGYQPDGAGVVYDGTPVIPGEMRPVDDNFCLMMIKML